MAPIPSTNSRGGLPRQSGAPEMRHRLLKSFLCISTPYGREYHHIYPRCDRNDPQPTIGELAVSTESLSSFPSSGIGLFSDRALWTPSGDNIAITPSEKKTTVFHFSLLVSIAVINTGGDRFRLISPMGNPSYDIHIDTKISSAVTITLQSMGR